MASSNSKALPPSDHRADTAAPPPPVATRLGLAFRATLIFITVLFAVAVSNSWRDPQRLVTLVYVVYGCVFLVAFVISIRMKMITVVLCLLFAFTAMLVHMATLPLIMPGYLAEGTTAPMDKTEVVAATEPLRNAAAILFLTVVMNQVDTPPAPRLLMLWTCAVVALTAYCAWDVIGVIIAWSGHIRGEHAMSYWFTLLEPVLILLVGVVLKVLLLFVE